MSVHYCGYEWLKRTYHLDIESPNPIAKIGGVRSPDSRIYRSEYKPDDQPFSDGNGRIHRFILHQLGKVPISSELFESIEAYIASLEKLSAPILDRSDWIMTADYNVELLNDTSELYRYADVTEQAEYIYQCIEKFVTLRLPQELAYLSAFYEARHLIDDTYDMVDKDLTLLINLCVQNGGRTAQEETKAF